MPMHDWTRVPAGLFHDFHQNWAVEIARALNRGALPEGYYALVEQRTGDPEPDVVLRTMACEGGTVRSIATRPVTVAASYSIDRARYAEKADRVSVRHVSGAVVSVIEIVSPGNKDGRRALEQFVSKAAAFLRQGVHFLFVDPFPPGRLAPRGLHPALWEDFQADDFELPPGRPLTAAAYSAGRELTAHVENFAVGDAVPEMPVFLTEERYVPCPLEATYAEAWGAFPRPLKGPLEAPPAATA